jgi:hypothetical protein
VEGRAVSVGGEWWWWWRRRGRDVNQLESLHSCSLVLSRIE